MKRARVFLWLGIVLVLATLLRARYAQQRESVWRDEAQDMALVATSDTTGEMLQRLRHEGHPPLHYLIERAVQRRWPGSLPALRWMAIVPAVLAIGLLFLLARRYFGARAALLTGVLAATSPFLVHYGTEVRAYGLFAFFGALYGHAFLLFLTRPRWWTAVLWGAVTAAMAYTHYYAVWIVAGGGVYALVRDLSAPNLRRIALGAATTLVLLAPWLPSLREQLSHDLQPWYRPKGDLRLAFTVFLLPLGRWGGLILLWGLVRGLLWTRRADATSAETLAFRGLFWTAAGASLAAFIGQMTRGPHLPRYLIPAVMLVLPPAALYWGRMLEESPLRRRLAVGLLVFALVFQYTDKAGWTRKAPSAAAKIARTVEEHGRPGDAIWISPAFFAPSFVFHYRGDLPIVTPPYRGRVQWVDWVDLMAKDEDPAVLNAYVAELEAHLRAGGRVWLVLDGYYPIGRDWAAKSERLSKEPRLVRQEVQNHRRLLRALYALAEDTYLWDGPDTEYRENMTLVLFDPARKR